MFPSSRLIQHDMLDAYPSGNSSCFINSYTFFLYQNSRHMLPFVFLYFSFSTISSNLGCLHINFKSCVSFSLSFVLSFYVHDDVEHIVKHILFNMHTIQIMSNKIGGPMRQFPKICFSLASYEFYQS